MFAPDREPSAAGRRESPGSSSAFDQRRPDNPGAASLLQDRAPQPAARPYDPDQLRLPERRSGMERVVSRRRSSNHVGRFSVNVDYTDYAGGQPTTTTFRDRSRPGTASSTSGASRRPTCGRPGLTHARDLHSRRAAHRLDRARSRHRRHAGFTLLACWRRRGPGSSRSNQRSLSTS